jgi:hypothetical protein
MPTAGFMALVKHLGIPATKVTHAEAEVRGGCLDDQMEMVRHQAVAEEMPATVSGNVMQQAEKRAVIARVTEDRLTAIPPLPDVMDASS